MQLGHKFMRYTKQLTVYKSEDKGMRQTARNNWGISDRDVGNRDRRPQHWRLRHRRPRQRVLESQSDNQHEVAVAGAKRCGREAASDEAKGWTFLIDTKYEMKWGMSDGEWLACICNRRTPLMLNDKKRKARDKCKLKRLT